MAVDVVEYDGVLFAFEQLRGEIGVLYSPILLLLFDVWNGCTARTQD